MFYMVELKDESVVQQSQVAALMLSLFGVGIMSMWSKIWTEDQNSKDSHASWTAWQQRL